MGWCSLVRTTDDILVTSRHYLLSYMKLIRFQLFGLDRDSEN